MMRNSAKCFYVRVEGWSFHPAKTFAEIPREPV